MRLVAAYPASWPRAPSPLGDHTGGKTRGFPAPWHADKMPGGYVVRDAKGQALVFVYSRDNDAEARQAKG
jgi:hypothetical protein